MAQSTVPPWDIWANVGYQKAFHFLLVFLVQFFFLAIFSLYIHFLSESCSVSFPYSLCCHTPATITYWTPSVASCSGPVFNTITTAFFLKWKSDCQPLFMSPQDKTNQQTNQNNHLFSGLSGPCVS